jgi:predicted nucleic acid-binding protein
VAASILHASVAAAVYVDHPATHDAEALLERLGREQADLHAPDLVLLEVANVLWRQVRRAELGAARAIARSALALAMAHGLTAYDSAYCAVATRLGATLVTNDADLRERAGAAGIPVTEPPDVL